MITEKEIKGQTKDPIKEQSKEKNDDLTVIHALRARCEASKTFNAMCHIFALRERTRKEITLSSLQASMLREGFKFTKQQYAEELKFMAGIGIGKLILNKKGAVRALGNVLVTLQSIGLAAVGRKEGLATFKPTIQYKALKPYTALDGVFETSAQTKPLPKLLEKKSPPVAKADDFQAYLTLIIDGKSLQFDLLPEFSTKELIAMMAKAARGTK